ncbi:MAG: phosphate ABC transporter substrate-binding protein [Candidatus Edwardsbacteria bacterium]
MKLKFINLGIFLLLLTSCGGKKETGLKEKQAIQIKGSDTMINLCQAWAEAFMKKYPKAFVAVTGGGSGTGIAALIDGTCDIAESSRKMKEGEIILANQRKILPVEFTVALDGIVVVVHPANPISELTIEQLAGIFTGKIANWKEIGGKDAEIVALSREVNSGTHIYFKEHILKGKEEFAPSVLLMPSSQAIADEITQNQNAIGYYGMGYLSPKQKAIAIAKDNKGPYVLPLIENVVNGTYQISRPLLMYTNGQPQGLVKEFIDFVLGDEGQGIVKQQDFVPITLSETKKIKN